MDDSKLYEIAFLVKSPEEERVVSDLIAQLRGNILQKSPLQETRLAYPIKKHSSAYFGYLHFELLPADLEKLSLALKLSPAVLRYLTVSLPEAKGGPLKKKPAEKERETSPAAAVRRTILTNEALEEKLEEILK